MGKHDTIELKLQILQPIMSIKGTACFYKNLLRKLWNINILILQKFTKLIISIPFKSHAKFVVYY